MKHSFFVAISVATVILFSACKKDKKDDPTTTEDTKLELGAEHQGGIIVYLDGTGNHGIVASKINLGTDVQWGCFGSLLTGTFSTAIGSGQANTNLILSGCTTAGIAAKLCDDYSAGGYSDWYLPSKDELNKLYYVKSSIPDLKDNAYWSSSQSDADEAYMQSFDEENAFTDSDKDNTANVRAVRKF